MQFSDYVRFIRRWWWLLIASAALGGGFAYAGSTRVTPTYEATATLLVVQQATPGIIQANDLQTSVLLANTFRGMITIRPLLEQAVVQGGFPMNPDELRGAVRVENQPQTNLLRVIARANAPDLAREMANVVSEVFIASDQMALTSTQAVVSIIEPAATPGYPVSPRKTLNALIGTVVSLVACALLIFLFEYLDNTVKSPQGILELTGLVTLGQIGRFKSVKTPSEQLQAAMHPHSAVAESYRAARAVVTNMLTRDETTVMQALLFTAPNRNDGKSTTVSNLGVVFGAAGYRVAVVDGDLRAPMLHRIFSLDNSAGLANLLVSEATSLARAAQRTVHPNVTVITAGPTPPNPSELLASARMRELLWELRRNYDLVLVDSPPALAVSDSSSLAGAVDGVVLIVQSNRTRTDDLKATVEQIATSGRPILGVVMNRVGDRGRSFRYGNYGQRPEAGQGALEPAGWPPQVAERRPTMLAEEDRAAQR